jgi:fatty acid elongase 3
MGYSPEQFRFLPGKTPISTFPATAGLLLTYYITIFAGREFMKNRAPLNLNSLFMVHNLYLTIISGTLLALFIEQLLPTVWRNGIFYAICNHRGGSTDRLVVLYYVSPLAEAPQVRRQADRVQLNYLTKYIELIDTLFMFLKKKPLSEWERKTLSVAD